MSSTDLRPKCCHVCHQHNAPNVLCTAKTKARMTKPCTKAICDCCLMRKFKIDGATIRAAGIPADADPARHDLTGQYVFECPVCQNACECSTCQARCVRSAIQGSQTQVAPASAVPQVEATVSTSASNPNETTPTSSAVPEGEPMQQLLEEVQNLPQEKASRPTLHKTSTYTSRELKRKVPPDCDKENANNASKSSTGGANKRRKKEPEQASDATELTEKELTKLLPINPPIFEHIKIDHPLPIIWERLSFREFVLRFEELLPKQLLKYISTINDPNSAWSSSTYKSIFLALLRALNDQEFFRDHEMVDERIKQLSKTYAEGSEIWSLLHAIVKGRELEDHAILADEASKMKLLINVSTMFLGTDLLRNALNTADQDRRLCEKTKNDEVKKIETEWSHKIKCLRSKKPKTALCVQYKSWQNNYNVECRFMKKEIKQVEERYWLQSRKKDTRSNNFLGTDIKGNTYHLFIQRTQGIKDWGRWIVVVKNEVLPHPSGDLSSARNPAERQADDANMNAADASTPLSESHMWYAFDDPASARQLADWIKYCWIEFVYGEKIKQQQKDDDPAVGAKNLAESTASPAQKGSGHPSDDSTRCMNISTSNLNLEDLDYIREQIDNLVHQIRKIAEFWEVDIERNRDQEKLPA